MSRVTERANALSESLDASSSAEIVRVLRAVDAQLWSGFGGMEGVLDEGPRRAAEDMARLWADRIREAVPDARPTVVLSGSGTSGRLAHLCATAFNRALARRGVPSVFGYLASGGDVALVAAQESAEDDAPAGVRDLLALVGEEGPRVVLVGVTCGLSAPYVAGQLAHCAARPDRFTPCVLGFNPPALARDAPIRGVAFTFRGALEAAARAPGSVLLTPVVGPEAVAGSTRMKGGSATKMLLEAVAARALGLCSVPDALGAFHAAYRGAYADAHGLARLVEAGGRALRAGGRIVYLGAGTAGLLGFIDASEQPPTFGAAPDDVRGFVAGGWAAFGNREGDLAPHGERYRVGLDHFERAVLPRLGGADLVVALPDIGGGGDSGDELERLLGLAAAAGAATAVLSAGAGADVACAFRVSVAPPPAVAEPEPGMPVLAELALKLALNAVSTGAHVLKGCVYRNRMVSVRLSNNKLVFRAVSIVSDLAGCSERAAQVAVLRAAHQTDRLEPAQLRMDPDAVARHVAAAGSAPAIVPVALVLAASAGDLTVAEAQRAVRDEPVVRRTIERLVG